MLWYRSQRFFVGPLNVKKSGHLSSTAVIQVYLKKNETQMRPTMLSGRLLVEEPRLPSAKNQLPQKATSVREGQQFSCEPCLIDGAARFRNNPMLIQRRYPRIHETKSKQRHTPPRQNRKQPTRTCSVVRCFVRNEYKTFFLNVVLICFTIPPPVLGFLFVVFSRLPRLAVK